MEGSQHIGLEPFLVRALMGDDGLYLSITVGEILRIFFRQQRTDIHLFHMQRVIFKMASTLPCRNLMYESMKF